MGYVDCDMFDIPDEIVAQGLPQLA